MRAQGVCDVYEFAERERERRATHAHDIHLSSIDLLPTLVKALGKMRRQCACDTENFAPRCAWMGAFCLEYKLKKTKESC